MSDFTNQYQAVSPVTITSLSPEAIGWPWLSTMLVSAVPASVTFATANLAEYVPFTLGAPFNALTMFAYVGATTGGNLDIGIYDEEGNRIVSKGSTVVGTINLLQQLDITDTLLNPGRYYMALNCDTAATTFFGYSPTAQQLSMCGVLNQAVGAVTLPATATFATATSTRLHYFGLSGRTLL